MLQKIKSLLTPKTFSLLLVFFLVALTLVTRLAPVWPGNFSYAYDNAKDSLVIMEMGTRFKPALFGAVTSIPGVYNGPLYYYLALPLNMLLGYHPIAGVLTVVLFAVLSTWLAYKAWGWWGGFLYAVSMGVAGSQQSAWSPYMTVFITLPVIIVLQQLIFLAKKKKAKKQTLLNHTWRWVALFGLISASFHFQTAFGVVLLPLVILILFLTKVQPTWKQCIVSVVAFVLPFAPLVAFELRHSFHQTKQVINFIQNYQDQAQVIGDNKKGLARIVEVSTYAINTAGKSVLPLDVPLAGWIVVLISVGYVWYVWKHGEKSNLIIWLVLLIGPLVLYLVLPVKEYYLVALIPVWISLFADLLSKKVPEKVQIIIAALLLIGVVVQVANGRIIYQQLAVKSPALYQPKADAISKIYELSDGRPFSSYHFVPEIYDYTYQHIYLQQINQGKPVPAEFSYAPGEVAYIQQKHLEAKSNSTDLVYLIVEDFVYQDVFENWKNRVSENLIITNEYKINQGITVYETLRQASDGSESVAIIE